MNDAPEVRIIAEGQCAIDHPPLEGVVCEVQHAIGKGDFTTEKGKVGLGLVVLPTGQPRIVLQVQHPDGTSLGAIFGGAEKMALREIFAECDNRASAISTAADRTVRQ